MEAIAGGAVAPTSRRRDGFAFGEELADKALDFGSGTHWTGSIGLSHQGTAAGTRILALVSDSTEPVEMSQLAGFEHLAERVFP